MAAIVVVADWCGGSEIGMVADTSTKPWFPFQQVRRRLTALGLLALWESPDRIDP